MSTAASRYSADLDLTGVNDAHIMAIGRVPARSRVLDLGLADGSVAALLTRTGCTVSGVEIDPVAAEAARVQCDQVVVADLDGLDLAGHFGARRFDVVLMLDVLEHLRNPAAVLAGVSAVLAEDGWGVISLPNVAHASVRLALLQGRFTYTDAGLLDRTHLRFFDRQGMDELLAAAGWARFDLARVIRPLGTTEIPLPDPAPDPAVMTGLVDDLEARTYQFVVAGAPQGSPVLQNPPTLPAAAAQEAAMTAQAQAASLDAELARLRRMVLPDLDHQLAAVVDSSRERTRALRGVLAEAQTAFRSLRERN